MMKNWDAFAFKYAFAKSCTHNPRWSLMFWNSTSYVGRKESTARYVLIVVALSAIKEAESRNVRRTN